MWIKDNKKNKKEKGRRRGTFRPQKKKQGEKRKKRWTFMQRIGEKCLTSPAGITVSSNHGALIVADKQANQVEFPPRRIGGWFRRTAALDVAERSGFRINET